MNVNISAREQEVLHLIAYEHNSREIAQQLYISEHTVITHRKNLITKLDVRNSAGLVRRAFEMGYLKVQLGLFLVFSFISILPGQDIVYVDHQASGANDGTTWNNAFTTLSLALDSANPGDSVFISEGVYTPPDTGRNSSFLLRDLLTIVGGFDPHNGISEYNDIVSFSFNKVTLSGDIGIEGDSTDNSYHVVKDLAPGELAIGCRLIGCTITEGIADGPGGTESAKGGGILIRGGKLTMSFITFNFNFASEEGAGIWADHSIITLFQVSINDNICNGSGTLFVSHSELTYESSVCLRNSSFLGGGLYSLNSNITFKECFFSSNHANSGGGIYMIGSRGQIDRSRFHSHSAETGGAIYVSGDSLTTIANSIITLNSASNRAGGIYVTSMAHVELINVNVNYNTANLDQGSGIYNSQGSCTMLNSIICCNNPHAAIGASQNYNSFNPVISEAGHSYIEYSGGSETWGVINTTDLGGNIDVDPMFKWIDIGDTLRQMIGCASPFINKGNNIYNPLTLDYSNNTRVIRDTIDIGAQEYQHDEIDLLWTGGGDGIHWHDQANWSCPRVPTQFDNVTLDSFGDTIVVDTGSVAVAASIEINNHCTLLVKEDLTNQNHGRVITDKISLSVVEEGNRANSKAFPSSDSAYLINRGLISILQNGLTCIQFCHIINENEIELDNSGVNLNPSDCFINNGTMNIAIQGDQAIDIGPSSDGAEGNELFNAYEKRINQKVMNNMTFHNLPGAALNIIGTVMGPNDQGSDKGIVIDIGSFLNEGVITMSNLKDAIVLVDDDMSRPGPLLKRNALADFQNDGTINIANTKIGIIGSPNGRFTNNTDVTGINLWTCPIEIITGFDFCNFGTLNLGN